ncbi:MAG TPA: TSUP family transporter, partial [Terriglobales bacterium]|nr:TSUP family transporter [Terriglobales bacterium]
MEVVLGFIIAATVGITGIGGGSFTTPVLVLLIGLPAGEAVGTAMVFAAVLRLLAAPFYVIGRNVDSKYLRFLLLGALPGLLIGTWLLRLMRTQVWSPIALLIIGIMLTFSSALTFAPRVRQPQLTRRRSGWLSLLALPIGVETGFSSAGAGALGTVLLLNYSELS